MRVKTSNPADPGGPGAAACPGGGLEPLEPRLLFCAAGAVTADLASNLNAWWRFDQAGGATTAEDSSGSASTHNGTLNGGAAVSALGLCNGSAAFDGGEMNVANHADFNLATLGQRTIAMWFWAEDTDAPGRQFLYEEGASVRGLNIYLEDGRLYVGGWNQPGGESNWQGTWLSTGAVASGRWHHVVLVLDGGATLEDGALRGYLDGVEFGRGEGSQLWPHSGDITLGNSGDSRVPAGAVGGGSDPFVGFLDDVRFYQRVLTAHDIAVLSGQFNEGAAITLATTWRDAVAVTSDRGEQIKENDAASEPESGSKDAQIVDNPVNATGADPAERYAAPGVDQTQTTTPTDTPADTGEAPPPPQPTGTVAQHQPPSAETGPTDGEPPAEPASDADEPRVAEVETEGKRQDKGRPQPAMSTPIEGPNASMTETGLPGSPSPGRQYASPPQNRPDPCRHR